MGTGNMLLSVDLLWRRMVNQIDIGVDRRWLYPPLRVDMGAVNYSEGSDAWIFAARVLNSSSGG